MSEQHWLLREKRGLQVKGDASLAKFPCQHSPKDGSGLADHLLIFHFNTFSFNLYPCSFHSTPHKFTKLLGTLSSSYSTPKVPSPAHRRVSDQPQDPSLLPLGRDHRSPTSTASSPDPARVIQGNDKRRFAFAQTPTKQVLPLSGWRRHPNAGKPAFAGSKTHGQQL